MIQLSGSNLPVPNGSAPKRHPWGKVIAIGIGTLVVAVLLGWLAYVLTSDNSSVAQKPPLNVSTGAPTSAGDPTDSSSPSDSATPTATPSPSDSSTSATPTASPTATKTAAAPQPTGAKHTVSFTLTTQHGKFRTTIVRQPLQHYVPGTDFGAAALSQCGYTPVDGDVVVPMTITMKNLSASAYSPGLGAARLVQFDPSDWEDSFMLDMATTASPATGCPATTDRSDEYTLGYLSATVLAPGQSETFTGYLIIQGGYDNSGSFGTMASDTVLSFGLQDATSVTDISGLAQPSSAFVGVKLGVSPGDYAPAN